MNFGKIISSFTAGLLVFVAILFAENARFEFKHNIKNPFTRMEDVARLNFDVLDKQKTTEVFSIDREFFRFYPNSVINFNNKKREIIDGNIFITTQFIKDTDTKKAKNSFFSPFNSNEFTPLIAQFKIGNFYINMPNSSVFISRDKKEKRTKIYAVNHSVELFFENSTIPFSIPSNMLVDIREDLITEKTGKLYYTKLKKELRMQSFIINLASSKDENEINAKNETRIAKSIKSQNSLHYEIKDFAQKIPKTWIWFESDGIMGTLVSAIKIIQSKVAIGFPESKLKRFKFNQIIKPFVFANAAVIKNEPSLASEYLQTFDEKFEKNLWFKLLLEKEIESDWSTFQNAHKSWIRNIFPDDPAQVFVKFWNKKNTTNSFADIDSLFSSIELLISNQHYQEAFNKIVETKNDVKNLKVLSTDKNKITKLRRLLFEIIKERSFFQQNEIFELYGILISKEIKIYKGEAKEEVALESAQNILFFLNNFIKKSDKSEISSTLVRIFKFLNINNITKRRGRRIFTAEELELIKTISFIGSSGLTKEIIKSINEKKEHEVLIRQQEKERITIPTSDVDIQGNKITGRMQFLEYLKKININTKNIKIVQLNTGYKFTNGIYSKFHVAGTFNILTQKFTILTVGNEVEKNLSRNTVSRFLQIAKNQKGNTTSSSSRQNPSKPPLKTQRAILERDLVQRFFKVINIEIEIADIIPLDFNYNSFRINNAIYKNESRLSFIYFKKQDTVEGTVIQTGWVTQELSPRKQISRKVLPKEIDRLLLSLLKNQ